MCGKIISSKNLKARKEHRCEACHVPIPSGITYCRTVEVDDGGDIGATRWHLECREAFDQMIHENMDDCGDPWNTWENDMPQEIRAKYVLGPWEQRA